MIQVLKLYDYQKMPWKNGLGSTFEIARQSSLAKGDFDWRVSMADVENDGDFSYFEGKKRIISTLSGAGMRLQIPVQSAAVPALPSYNKHHRNQNSARMYPA